MNDTPDSLIVDDNVSASVECIVNYNIHRFSLLVSAVNIHPV